MTSPDQASWIGRKVSYRDKPDWVGIVQGDSYTPGNVRVQWSEPTIHTGVHRQVDLVRLDDPPTQEDLAKLMVL